MILILDGKKVTEGTLDELSVISMGMVFNGIDKDRIIVTWPEYMDDYITQADSTSGGVKSDD